MTCAIIGIYLPCNLAFFDGESVQAIREDAIAASVAGINVPFYKLLAFVISASMRDSQEDTVRKSLDTSITTTSSSSVRTSCMVVLGGSEHMGRCDRCHRGNRDLWPDQGLLFLPTLIFGIIMVVMVVFMPYGIGGVKQAMIKRKFIEIHRSPVFCLEPKARASFGGVALQDVDVHIEEGSIHGLIGPNGSGKSTFLMWSQNWSSDSEVPSSLTTMSSQLRPTKLNSEFQEPSSCSGFSGNDGAGKRDGGISLPHPYGFLPDSSGFQSPEDENPGWDEWNAQFLARYANLLQGTSYVIRLLLGRAIAWNPNCFCLMNPVLTLPSMSITWWTPFSPQGKTNWRGGGGTHPQWWWIPWTDHHHHGQNEGSPKKSNDHRSKPQGKWPRESVRLSAWLEFKKVKLSLVLPVSIRCGRQVRIVLCVYFFFLNTGSQMWCSRGQKEEWGGTSPKQIQ